MLHFQHKDQEDGELVEMTLEAAINHINADHSEHFIPYDENDWVEGMIEWGSYNPLFGAGQHFYWTDPDGDKCSKEVVLSVNTLVVTMDETMHCHEGEFPMYELTPLF